MSGSPSYFERPEGLLLVRRCSEHVRDLQLPAREVTFGARWEMFKRDHDVYAQTYGDSIPFVDNSANVCVMFSVISRVIDFFFCVGSTQISSCACPADDTSRSSKVTQEANRRQEHQEPNIIQHGSVEPSTAKKNEVLVEE